MGPDTPLKRVGEGGNTPMFSYKSSQRGVDSGVDIGKKGG